MTDLSSFPICKSYVHRKDKCWFVSTIDRECSAMGAGGMRYWETMVWAYDPEKRDRADDHILFQGEGPKCHAKVVESLMFTGELPKEEE